MLEGFDEHENRVQNLSPSSSGNYIHTLLEKEFSDRDYLEFEQEVSSGQYDCMGPELLYEFKTKTPHGLEKAPYERDFEQLQRYLNSHDVDADQGQVIYINREDFSNVRQFQLQLNYNTDFIADGGLPDFSEYEVYELDFD